MRTFIVDPEGTARVSSSQPESQIPDPGFKPFQYTPRNQYQYRGPFSPPGRVEPVAVHSPASPARFVIGVLLWFSPLLLLLLFTGPKSEEDPYVYKTAPGGRTVIDKAATARKKQEKLLRDSKRMLEARKPPQYATVEEWQQAVRNSDDSMKLLQASIRERFGPGGNKRWGELYMKASKALKRGDRQEARQYLKIIAAERAARIRRALRQLNAANGLDGDSTYRR